VNRRAFITLLGAVAAWPLAARGQQREPMRRIGVLLPATPDDPVWQARLGAFLQGLALLDWTIGRNAQIDIRWGTSNISELRRHAAEMAALAPDVILAGGASTMGPLMETIRTVPIVFTLGNDPVGAGYVDSLARPGGNITGFMSYEFSIAGKWLELLKELAPAINRVGVLRDASQAFATSLFGAMRAVAPSLGVEVIPINLRNTAEIEGSVESFARSANGGLIPVSSAAAVHHRDLIIALAARYKLPAVYGSVSSSPPAAWRLMGPISSTNSGKRPAMSLVSSRERSRPIFRCRRRPSTSWRLISKPRGQSGSPCRRRC
jgi:putative ABC transport system substrate-binding protein